VKNVAFSVAPCDDGVVSASFLQPNTMTLAHAACSGCRGQNAPVSAPSLGCTRADEPCNEAHTRAPKRRYVCVSLHAFV
jgi:hypothetical protein